MAPDKTNAYILLANILLAENRSDEALDYYNKAIQINPDDSDTYKLIGNTHAILDNLDLAIRNYRKAIQYDKDSNELKLVYFEIIDEFINRKEALYVE